MSTHPPHVTFEGLDIYTWAAARWLGIDPETAGRVANGEPDDDLWEEDRIVNREAYTNGDRMDDVEDGRSMGDGGDLWTAVRWRLL